MAQGRDFKKKDLGGGWDFRDGSLKSFQLQAVLERCVHVCCCCCWLVFAIFLINWLIHLDITAVLFI